MSKEKMLQEIERAQIVINQNKEKSFTGKNEAEIPLYGRNGMD